jgi:ABC-type multidrug transport system fused ATPase/permease subunit
MRELLLLKQLNESYRRLNLKCSRLTLALGLMLVTAVLEMTGLSILYPLVLVLGSSGRLPEVLSAYLPMPEALGRDARAQVIVLFGAVAILNVAKNVGLYFSYRYNIDFAMYYYRHLIRGLYHAYVHKSVSEFRRESAGSLANIICVQSGRLVDGVIRPLLVVVTEAILLLAISVLVFLVSPLLIVVIILTSGVAGASYYALLRAKAVKWGRRRMHAASVLQELVSNTSAGIREIKVFGKEDYLTSKIYSTATIEAAMFRNSEMYQQGPRYLMESVFVVTFASSCVVLLVAGEGLSHLLAKLSVVAASAFRILPCVNRLVHSYSSFSFNIEPALALLHAISEHELLAASPAMRGARNSPRGSGGGVIRLENVSFEYPLVNRPVLGQINAAIARGQRVGIVGASGSGKSTLIEILAGLYMPTGGTVSVDGEAVSEDPRSWQASIGYVPQVPFIMPGTVRENVAFEDEGSGRDEEVWRALETVGLSTFVGSLPKGIDVEIGEKGVELSLGQKQLLCMARALFRNPQTLLLDEPTAGLDLNNEQMVMNAIRKLPLDTTVIMVSHNTENFRDFDCVYVCEDGKLIVVTSEGDSQMRVASPQVPDPPEQRP